VSTPAAERWQRAAVEGLPPDPAREMIMYMDHHVYVACTRAQAAPIWPVPDPPPHGKWGHAEAIVRHDFPPGGWVLCHAGGEPISGGVLTPDQLAAFAEPADPFELLGAYDL
jgi:hypothetical protein